MARSARASVIKKNKSGLKKKVFGPVETARNERLNAKLLALATASKPLREDMEVDNGQMTGEGDVGDTGVKAADTNMEVEDASTSKTKSNDDSSSGKKRRSGNTHRTRHRKAKNNIAFAKHPMKVVKKGKRR